jgi:hypothetical protein
MPRGIPLDLTGQTFGRWKVLDRVQGCVRDVRWNCECACELRRQKEVSGTELVRGASRSCGCLHRELSSKRLRTHGMHGSPTYRSWTAMKTRCTIQSHEAFERYGGRGIRVCERWLESFENFFADMGVRPQGTELDRHPNNDGNYEPGNVRWATRTEQARHRRSSNVVEFRGERKTVAEWYALLGLSVSVTQVYRRLQKGWPVERAFS